MTSTLGASPTQQGSASTGAVSTIKDAAIEKTEEVREKLGSKVSERVSDETDRRSTEVGEHVTSIASALTETSDKLRAKGEDAPAKALDLVTDQADRLGTYLKQTSGQDLLHDIEDAARRRPWATAATLFGIGFAASRVLGASSRDRTASRSAGAPPTSYTPGSTVSSATNGSASRPDRSWETPGAGDVDY